MLTLGFNWKERRITFEKKGKRKETDCTCRMWNERIRIARKIALKTKRKRIIGMWRDSPLFYVFMGFSSKPANLTSDQKLWKHIRHFGIHDFLAASYSVRAGTLAREHILVSTRLVPRPFRLFIGASKLVNAKFWLLSAIGWKKISLQFLPLTNGLLAELIYFDVFDIQIIKNFDYLDFKNCNWKSPCMP